MQVTINPDADGYTEHECPTCEKYFKIKFGTGLLGEPDCHCPSGMDLDKAIADHRMHSVVNDQSCDSTLMRL